MSNERPLPQRTPIPPALYALVCCICVEHALMLMRPDALYVAILVLFSIIVCIVVWKRFCHEPFAETLCICAATVCAAAIVATVAAYAADGGTAALAESSVSSFELEIASDMLPSKTGYSGRCRVMQDGTFLGEARIVCAEQLLRTTHIRCVGRFSEPGQDEFGLSQRAEGLLGSIRVVRILEELPGRGIFSTLEGLRQYLLAQIHPEDSDSRALIAALALGWRSDFNDKGLDDLFATCGMSHIAAVSGSHVSVVCTIVGAIAVKSGAHPKKRFFLLASLTGVFVLMSGAPPSGIRAWCMCMCALGAHILGRRSDALSALCLCGLAMALINPRLQGNLGFLLSLICVGSLCLYSRYAAYVLDTLVGIVKFPKWIPAGVRLRISKGIQTTLHALAASLVASIAALPLTASAFGQISLIGPFMNALLAIPLPLLVGLSVSNICGSFASPLETSVLCASDATSSVFLRFLRACARIPGASIPVEVNQSIAFLIVVSGGVALYILWPRVNRKYVLALCGCVIALITATFIRARYFAPARLCVLDVGQGDAILIQDGSAAILIDTGPDESVARELSKLNVYHLDAVVLTHLHDDHYGGVGELLGHVGCSEVYVAEGAKENMPTELVEDVVELTDHEALELGVGSKLTVGSFELSCIWPHEQVSGSENEDSLVMLVNYSNKNCNFSGLLTGDAEHSVLTQCIHANQVGDIDVLKVGHHGSEASLDEADANVLIPELAIASAGYGNSYGHPGETCVEILEEVGATFLCTKDVGTVVVEPAVGSLHVRETGASHEVE